MILFIVGLILGANISLFIYTSMIVAKESEQKIEDRYKTEIEQEV